MTKSHLIGALACAAALVSSTSASAATNEVVREADVVRQAESTPPTADWVLYTRAGTPATAGAFADGPTAPPSGLGSFQTATATGAEKVFLFNFDHVGTPLADVDDISYSTFRSTGSAQQAPALNAVVDFNGPAVEGGFTTLVFEPVYNTAQGPVVSGEWQDWIADGSGVWWSTRAIPGVCAFNCFVPLEDIIADNPDATVLGGVGINQGSGNPGLVAATDAFTFDETTYDFEPAERRPVSKDDCKDGGFATYTVGSEQTPLYRNQGECVSALARGDAG